VQNIGVGRAACALLEQLREVMRTHAGIAESCTKLVFSSRLAAM
jgi:hypothetical protein